MNSATLPFSMKEVLKEYQGSLEKAMETLRPDLLAKFYPRIYENTGRYHSPRQCAAFLANSVAESLNIGYRHAPTSHKILMPALEQMSRRRMPLLFLAPDLVEAVQRTDFHDDIDWTEMHLPYEQGIFILPRGAFRHPEDGDVSMIVWMRLQPGDYPPPDPGIPVISINSLSMAILALCPENCIWYDSCINSSNRPTIRLNNLFYRQPGETYPLRAVGFFDSDLSEKDQEFLEKMGTITFGTFLAMHARPELVEHGKLLRRVGKAGQAREFWSPNIVGPRYRLKKEVPRIVGGRFVSATTRETGSHASPRLHWRRGHFRNQAHGAGRRERKTIWIEPMLIGAEGDL